MGEPDPRSEDSPQRGVFEQGFDPLVFSHRAAVLNDTVRVSLGGAPLDDSSFDPSGRGKNWRGNRNRRGGTPSDSGFDPSESGIRGSCGATGESS